MAFGVDPFELGKRAVQGAAKPVAKKKAKPKKNTPKKQEPIVGLGIVPDIDPVSQITGGAVQSRQTGIDRRYIRVDKEGNVLERTNRLGKDIFVPTFEKSDKPSGEYVEFSPPIFSRQYTNVPNVSIEDLIDIKFHAPDEMTRRTRAFREYATKASPILTPPETPLQAGMQVLELAGLPASGISFAATGEPTLTEAMMKKFPEQALAAGVIGFTGDIFLDPSNILGGVSHIDDAARLVRLTRKLGKAGEIGEDIVRQSDNVYKLAKEGKLTVGDVDSLIDIANKTGNENVLKAATRIKQKAFKTTPTPRVSEPTPPVEAEIAKLDVPETVAKIDEPISLQSAIDTDFDKSYGQKIRQKIAQKKVEISDFIGAKKTRPWLVRELTSDMNRLGDYDNDLYGMRKLLSDSRRSAITAITKGKTVRKLDAQGRVIGGLMPDIEFTGRRTFGAPEPVIDKSITYQHVLEPINNLPYNQTRSVLEGKRTPLTKYVDNILGARQAKTMLEQGKPTGRLTPEIIEKIEKSVADLPEPQRTAVLETVDRARVVADYPLEYAYQMGVFSAEDVERMKLKNPFYAPMQRVIEEGLTQKSKSQIVRMFKTRKGSYKQVKSPLQTIFDNAVLARMWVDRQVFHREVVDRISEINPDIVMPVKISKPEDEVAKLADEMLSEMNIEKTEASTDMMEEAVRTFWKPSEHDPNSTLHFKRDGVDELWGIDDEILIDAIKQEDPIKLNWALGALSKLGETAAKVQKAGVTLSGNFILPNLLMDTYMRVVARPKSLVQFGMDMAKWPASLAKGMVAPVGAKNINIALREMGAGGTFFEEAMKAQDYIKKYGKTRDFETIGIPLLTSANPFYWLNKMASWSEQPNRTVEAINELNRTGNIGKAALAYRSLADYREQGRLVRKIGKYFPFFSAGITGARTLYKYAKANPTGFALRSMIGVTIPAIMLEQNYGDEKWYQDIPRDIKNRYFIWGKTKIGGKEKIIRSPKPWEMGQIFGTLPQSLYDHFTDDGKIALDNDWKDLTTNLMDMMRYSVPRAENPILQTYLDIKSNEKSFFKTPIESKWDIAQNIDPSLRTNLGVPSWIDVAASKGSMLNKMGISPAEMDYIIQRNTAYTGKDINKLYQLWLEAIGERPEQLRGVEVIPGIGRFVTDAETTYTEPSANANEITAKGMSEYQSYLAAIKDGRDDIDKYITDDAVFYRFIIKNTEADVAQRDFTKYAKDAIYGNGIFENSPLDKRKEAKALAVKNANAAATFIDDEYKKFKLDPKAYMRQVAKDNGVKKRFEQYLRKANEGDSQ